MIATPLLLRFGPQLDLVGLTTCETANLLVRDFFSPAT